MFTVAAALQSIADLLSAKPRATESDLARHLSAQGFLSTEIYQALCQFERNQNQ